MGVRRTIYKSLLSSLIVVLTPFLVLVGSMAQDSSFATQALAVDLADISWGPPGGGNGVPMGVRTARQGIDPATGGVTYYAMFPAGSHFDLHWHTHDEFVVVVQGTVTIELGEETYSLELGSYVVIPGRMNHSWDVPEGDDVVILVRRAGPADFSFVGK
jgi:mannose-6-phosphate isomerase-like protein (cupin superfamily)